MRSMHMRIALICLGLSVVLAGVSVAAPTAEQIEKMREAMPDEPVVKAKEGRKLLVFTKCKGYVHGSIPYATKSLELMAEKTGAFSIVVSNDMKVFRPETLEQFDAVCFNNTTKLTFDEEPGLKKSLMNFVKSGKGVVGIHAATDNFYEWDEAARMMGGVFDGHPWTAGGTWAFEVEDTGSPLTAAFENVKFKDKDEIYRTKQMGLRENCRVLVRLDLTDNVTGSAGGIRPSDVDIPVSWIRSYGDGRVYYCGFGHNAHIYWNAEIMEHLLAGVQFAMGDLEADTTPVAFDPLSLVDFERLEAILAEVGEYEYGQSRAVVYQLDSFLAGLPEAAVMSGEVQKELGEFLKSEASAAGKKVVCEKLSVYGTEDSAGVLAGLLDDDELGDVARYALERIPGESVDKVLVGELEGASGDQAVGLITTIGRRGIEGALSSVAAKLGSSDQKVQAAALIAIGRIGNRDALKVLQEQKDEFSGDAELQEVFVTALLQCADGLAAKGDKDGAVFIYVNVFKSDWSLSQRVAGLSGLIEAAPEYGVEQVVDLLQGDDEEMKSAAIGLVRLAESGDVAASLAAELGGLNDDIKVQLIGVLQDMGERTAAEAITAAAGSEDMEVRVAAVEALGSLGGSEHVKMLAETAAEDAGNVGEVARESLYRLNEAGVNDKIAELAVSDETGADVRVELIGAIEQRKIESAQGELLELAKSDVQDVSLAALKAMRSVGGGDFDELVEIMINADSSRRSRAAGVAVLARSQKDADAEKRAVKALAGGMQDASDPRSAQSILAIMGKIGNDAALPYIREALRSDDDRMVSGAVKALSGWPSTSPADDLLEVARTSESARTRSMAIRGYVNLAKHVKTGAAEMLEKAIEAAERPAEKKYALGVLGGVKSPAALELAESLAGDEAVGEEAKIAVKKIREALAKNVIEAEASRNSGKVGNAFDDDPGTRWDTGRPMKPGDWFMIDLGYAMNVKQIKLDAKGSANDYPRGYEVYASKDKSEWGESVATGEASKPVVEIELDTDQPVRYLKIVQTGSSGSYYWSIHEMDFVFE
ncbi:Cytochrome c551/c552 [Anaerohalosphaera lusitana]|uniref:Cytochrome c551/c552 n=1 Tax=Anaerohalosphaera lusitana TaxID=1936003 RepID=A0A1U9NNG7_9BACT|nr:ThuA domain-containing protein [Anaerohalosphaera lusitana]AQT69278.1 Cytochrome c551/c552 [Anaerohalosphaera lusitana]